MYIVSKDRTAVINVGQMQALYISSDGYALRADFGGKMWNVGRYSTIAETQAALIIVAKEMGCSGKAVIYMPGDDVVRAEMHNNGHKEMYRHLDGRKTKGHGGS